MCLNPCDSTRMVLECRSLNRGGLAVKGLPLAVALLVASRAFSPAPPADLTSSIDGLWDAIVVANGTDIPFRFEISTNGAETQGFFFEGDRKVGSTSGRFFDGALTLDYDFLNTTLDLALDGGELIGTYRNKRAGARPQVVRMRRFTPVVLGDGDAPPLAGSWEMRRNADEATASPDT